MRLSKVMFTVPLLFISLSGHAAIAPRLADPDAPQNQEESLIAAAENGHVEKVKRALDAGVDVDARNEYGSTALMRAAFAGRRDVVQVLLQSSAQIEAANAEGYTALHFAAAGGKGDIAGVLVKAGANPNAEGKYSGSPVHEAARTKDGLKALKILIAAGGDCNAQFKGYTPLHAAAERGRVLQVDELIRKGAKVDTREDALGATPLYLAVIRGHAGVVERLVGAGADISIGTRRGTTPLMMAQEKARDDIVKILRGGGRERQ